MHTRRVTEPLHLDDVFAGFSEPWSPRVVATVNDYDVKVARGQGEFAEHAHADTDEFFLVLAGTLHLDLHEPDRPARTVTLHAGGTFTVPRGRAAPAAGRGGDPAAVPRAAGDDQHRRRAGRHGHDRHPPGRLSPTPHLRRPLVTARGG